MKGTKSIFEFKRLIRFFVSIFASREMGFIYCLIGTITQVAHTYFLTSEISSFGGWWKVAQAVLLSTFISSSLLYFVVISDNSDTKESKRIHLAINIFMFIEIVINLYYYSRKLIIDAQEMEIFDFIFAILVSCLIPVVIKLYAGLIQAKEWFEEFAKDKNEKIENNNVELNAEIQNQIKSLQEKILSFDEINNKVDSFIEEVKSSKIDKEIIKELVINEFDKITGDYRSKLNSQMAESFERNSSMFLQQFENKLKMLLRQYDNKKPSGM